MYGLVDYALRLRKQVVYLLRKWFGRMRCSAPVVWGSRQLFAVRFLQFPSGAICERRPCTKSSSPSLNRKRSAEFVWRGQRSRQQDLTTAAHGVVSHRLKERASYVRLIRVVNDGRGHWHRLYCNTCQKLSISYCLRRKLMKASRNTATVKKLSETDLRDDYSVMYYACNKLDTSCRERENFGESELQKTYAEQRSSRNAIIVRVIRRAQYGNHSSPRKKKINDTMLRRVVKTVLESWVARIDASSTRRAHCLPTARAHAS